MILVRILRENVAKPFNTAIYRMREVNRTFATYAEARKLYNLRNCCYEVCDEDGNVLKRVNNISYQHAW